MRKIKTAQETSLELRDELESALLHPREIFGYARYGNGLKWSRLDYMTGGLQDRSLAVLAARPKRGKSMLAADWVVPIAYQAMAAGEVVRVVSLEMTRKAYQRRMAALIAGIKEPRNIRRGMLDVEEQRMYRRALDTIAELPIEYLSNEVNLSEQDALKPGNSPVSFDEVERFIQARKGQPTYWSLLDHIGLLNDLDRYGDVTTSIYSLANKLAVLAHTTASMLVITHLTRASTGSMPTIESIAGSDQVGKNADQIFLLSRPFMDVPELGEEDKAFLEAAEGEPAFLQFYSRDEGSGLDVLWWQYKYARFNEMDIAEDVKIPMPTPKRKR